MDRSHGQYLRAEGPASIEDDEPGHGLERERFSKLLDDPGRGRARRYAEPRDFSPPVAEDDQDVENPEGRRGDSEEVHGGNGLAVVP